MTGVNIFHDQYLQRSKPTLPVSKFHQLSMGCINGEEVGADVPSVVNSGMCLHSPPRAHVISKLHEKKIFS